MQPQPQQQQHQMQSTHQQPSSQYKPMQTTQQRVPTQTQSTVNPQFQQGNMNRPSNEYQSSVPTQRQMDPYHQQQPNYPRTSTTATPTNYHAPTPSTSIPTPTHNETQSHIVANLCEIIASHEVLPDLKAYFIGAQSKYGPQESQSIKEQLMIIGLCEKREVKQLEKISNIEKRMQSLKDNLEKMLKLQYEKTTKEIQQHALFAKFRMSCDKDPHYKNAYSSLFTSNPGDPAIRQQFTLKRLRQTLEGLNAKLAHVNTTNTANKVESTNQSHLVSNKPPQQVPHQMQGWSAQVGDPGKQSYPSQQNHSLGSGLEIEQHYSDSHSKEKIFTAQAIPQKQLPTTHQVSHPPQQYMGSQQQQQHHSQFSTQSTQYGSQTSQYGSQPTQYGSQTTAYGSQSSNRSSASIQKPPMNTMQQQPPPTQGYKQSQSFESDHGSALSQPSIGYSAKVIPQNTRDQRFYDKSSTSLQGNLMPEEQKAVSSSQNYKKAIDEQAIVTKFDKVCENVLRYLKDPHLQSMELPDPSKPIDKKESPVNQPLMQNMKMANPQTGSQSSMTGGHSYDNFSSTAQQQSLRNKLQVTQTYQPSHQSNPQAQPYNPRGGMETENSAEDQDPSKKKIKYNPPPQQERNVYEKIKERLKEQVAALKREGYDCKSDSADGLQGVYNLCFFKPRRPDWTVNILIPLSMEPFRMKVKTNPNYVPDEKISMFLRERELFKSVDAYFHPDNYAHINV